MRLLLLRYDDDPNSYFDWSKTIELEQSEPLVLNRNQKEQIDKTLTRLGLKADASSIFHFCRNAIELREFAKFEFTKTYLLRLR